MAIYRGPGGSGDATTDATNEATVASNAASAALASQTAAANSASSASTSATSAANSATSASTSASSAASSASTASTQASNASTSASNAATSETNAATSAANAATSYDDFDDRYLGSKASAPTLDNDGNALLTGALYWNSTSSTMNVWTGSAWTGLGGSSGVSSFNTRTGAVTLSSSDVTTALTYTPLNPANNLSEVTASTARTNLSVPSTTGSGATGTWNIDILGNAGTVTNGVYTTGNQTIGGTKTFSSTISGSIDGNAATVTNGVVTTGSYANPSWITSLAETKVLPSQTGNSGKYLTTNGTSTSWATVSGGGASALDDLTDVVLTSPSNGQVLKYNGTNWVNDTDSVGSGSFAYPSAGIALSTGSAWGVSITDNSSNWNTAYTDRLKWDGGSTGLTASTGRTSLGATTIGSNLFTLADPAAITFPRFNADNTVSSLNASDFRTAIGAGTGAGTVTSVSGTGSVNGITLTGTVTSSGSLTLGGTLGSIANSQLTNSSVTVNGTAIALGASGTVTATATNALTIGTGLSGTSYNGSTAVTIANSAPMTYPTGSGIAVVSSGTSWGTTLTAPTGTIVGTSDTQTLTNKTLTSPTISGAILNDGFTEEVFAITDGASVALSPTNGSIQTWTLGANRTPTQGTWAAGQSMTLMIDDGTARTVTWTSIPVTWVGGSAPTLALTGYTIIVLWKVGTTVYGAATGSVA